MISPLARCLLGWRYLVVVKEELRCSLISTLASPDSSHSLKAYRLLDIFSPVALKELSEHPREEAEVASQRVSKLCRNGTEHPSWGEGVLQLDSNFLDTALKAWGIVEPRMRIGASVLTFRGS